MAENESTFNISDYMTILYSDIEKHGIVHNTGFTG